MAYTQREWLYEDALANNKRLKELLKFKEDAMNAKEGDVGVLKKERDNIVAALKRDQGNHQKTKEESRTVIATLEKAHATDLSQADEAYKRS